MPSKRLCERNTRWKYLGPTVPLCRGMGIGRTCTNDTNPSKNACLSNRQPSFNNALPLSPQLLPTGSIQTREASTKALQLSEEEEEEEAEEGSGRNTSAEERETEVRNATREEVWRRLQSSTEPGRSAAWFRSVIWKRKDVGWEEVKLS